MGLGFGLIPVGPVTQDELMNNAVSIFKSNAAAQTVTIHTVTAKKTFYMTNAWVSGYGDNNTGHGAVGTSAANFVQVDITSASGSNNIVYSPPLRIAAGTVINLTISGAASTKYFSGGVGGYEL